MGEYWLDGASDDRYNSDWTRIIQEWPINGQTFPKFADSIKRKWDYAEYTKDDVLKLLEEIVCRHERRCKSFFEGYNLKH